MLRVVTTEDQREQMVEHQLRRRDIRDPRVLAAFATVPREEFVGADLRRHAYDDSPVPIGFGQTISQPYVVAVTVQALALEGNERVLEIGAGSGYAAAILGKLAREVHTIERIRQLADSASERLARLVPTGITSRPPIASCSSSARGTSGPPAAATIAPYGACSGQPSVPSPHLTSTLW